MENEQSVQIGGQYGQFNARLTARQLCEGIPAAVDQLETVMTADCGGRATAQARRILEQIENAPEPHRLKLLAYVLANNRLLPPSKQELPTMWIPEEEIQRWEEQIGQQVVELVERIQADRPRLLEAAMRIWAFIERQPTPNARIVALAHILYGTQLVPYMELPQDHVSDEEFERFGEEHAELLYEVQLIVRQVGKYTDQEELLDQLATQMCLSGRERKIFRGHVLAVRREVDNPLGGLARLLGGLFG